MVRKRSKRNPDPSIPKEDPAIPAEAPTSPRGSADLEAVDSRIPDPETVSPERSVSSESEPAEAAPAKNNGRKRKRRRRKKSAGTSAAMISSEQEPPGKAADSVSAPAELPVLDKGGGSASLPEAADPAAGSSIANGGRKRKRRRKKRSGAAPASTAVRPTAEIAQPAPAAAYAEEGGRLEEAAGAVPPAGFKVCLSCGEMKPLGDFLRRTGKRSGGESRRGTCRDCRKRRRAAALEAGGEAADPLPPSALALPPIVLQDEEAAAEAVPKRRIRRPLPEPPAGALLEPTRESELRPTRQGTIRMRGRTDKGRRWQQETDLEMARCLVREHAAVVVNRFTIRRLYTNRSFRRYILERDQYTCHFCGEYGDTIDHLLPRAKGGHTTPLNCVCACMLCNQNKADRDLDEFMEDAEPIEDSLSEQIGPAF